jgi:hypothetical protein
MADTGQMLNSEMRGESIPTGAATDLQSKDSYISEPFYKNSVHKHIYLQKDIIAEKTPTQQRLGISDELR